MELGEEVAGRWRNCIMTGFMICNLEPNIIPRKLRRLKRVGRVEHMGRGVKIEIAYRVFGGKY